MKTYVNQTCLLVMLSLTLGAVTHAQTPPPQPQTDETVQLSPFTVQGSADTSYVASESTTGTRVATKIADLPFVVNIVTSEFLNDFDFFDIGANLGYTSSLSAVDEEGNFNLRGFTSINYKWNGFYRLGILDRVDIDRIEIIKGPNAAIYGQTSPAGQVNYISKVPKTTESEYIQFTYGSEDLARVEANINTPLGSIFGVRLYNLVAFAGMDNKYNYPYAYLHKRTFSDTLKAQFNNHSDLVIDVQWDKRLSNTGDVTLPFIVAPKTTTTFTGQLAPLALARFSQGGPLESQNREMTNFYANYENRFNDVWSLRIGAYGYDRHNSEIYNGNSVAYDPTFVDPNGDVGAIVGISAKQARILLNEDGAASQADLLAHYYMFHHSVENKTLFTIDWSENWRYRHETQLPATGKISQAIFPTAQDPNNPNYSFLPGGTVGNQDLYTVVTRNDKTRWDTIGLFLRDQATLLDGRLILFAGMRHDQVKYNLNLGTQFSPATFLVAIPGQVEHFTNTAWTPATGANFKLTKNIALYGNYSQSFEPSAQGAKLGDPPLGNTRGDGVDYGIKCNFFDNRLNFTVGGYYVTETGIKITVNDPVTGGTDTVPGGTQNSKGIESDATLQVNDSFSVLAGYGYVNARLTKEGTDTIADGLRPPMIPVDNGYLALKYSFTSSALKGLSVHTGLTYDGVSYPETTAKTVNEAHIQLPSYYAVEAGVDYSWTEHAFGTKFIHTVGFSVTNALNRDYVDVKLAPQAGRSFYISYNLSH